MIYATPNPTRAPAAALDTQVLHLVTRPAEPRLKPARAAGVGMPDDLAAEDRDRLLSAIKARLKLSIGEPADRVNMGQRRETAARVRAGVMECVAALDRLHLTLTEDAARNRQHELDAFDALGARPSGGGVGNEGPDRQVAARDALWRLPNRARFRERLLQALALARLEPQEFAVLTLDLEGLKPIQAALGTQAGDEVLGIVAARLLRTVRGHDMVSRLRGDEFVLFIANVAGRDQLRRLTCKVFDAVSAPIKTGGVEVTVRPNIGIAIGVADGASGAALVANAAAAMGHARRHKSGYAFFDERGKAWVPGRA